MIKYSIGLQIKKRLSVNRLYSTLPTRATVPQDRVSVNEQKGEKNRYVTKLQKYFEESDFKFRNEKQVEDLKKWMRYVYLREKPLLALDIEAWERNNGKITEIGVARYEPKKHQDSIFPAIEQYHFIVREHERMVNGRFCPNNKDRFMGGVSYNLKMNDCVKFLNALLEDYVKSAQDFVLVGHHIEADIKWLRSINVQIPENCAVVDTARLYGLTHTAGGTLRGILRYVGIPHGYLHNAANDAYYTMLAAFAYCDPGIRKEKKLDIFQPHDPKTSKQKGSIKQKKNFYDKSHCIFSDDGTLLYEQMIQNRPVRDSILVSDNRLVSNDRLVSDDILVSDNILVTEDRLVTDDGVVTDGRRVTMRD